MGTDHRSAPANRLLTAAISLTLLTSAAYAQTDKGAFGNDTQASSDSLPASAGATSTASGAAAVAHQGQRSHPDVQHAGGQHYDELDGGRAPPLR